MSTSQSCPVAASRTRLEVAVAHPETADWSEAHDGDATVARRPADGLPGMDVPAALATDTDAVAHRLMAAKWRAMTMAERVATIDALQHDCNALAVAGIREAEPDASPDRTRYLLAVRRYGRRLADEVYGHDRS